MSTFDLDTQQTASMIQEIGDVLIKHFGVLPDTVLVLRHGNNARTFFAGNNLATGEHPHDTLRGMLGEALAAHNRRHQPVRQ
jgi:hypothetical protein